MVKIHVSGHTYLQSLEPGVLKLKVGPFGGGPTITSKNFTHVSGETEKIQHLTTKTIVHVKKGSSGLAYAKVYDNYPVQHMKHQERTYSTSDTLKIGLKLRTKKSVYINIKRADYIRPNVLHIFVRNGIANDLSIRGVQIVHVFDDTLSYSLYGTCFGSKGLLEKLDEFTVLVPWGEFTYIYQAPEKDKIASVYGLPISLKYDDKVIYGRLISNKPVSAYVQLQSGKMFKLTIKPFITKTYEALSD